MNKLMDKLSGMLRGVRSKLASVKLTGVKKVLLNRVVVMASVTLCLVVLVSVVLLNTQMGFAVYMNGEVMGEAKDLDDVENVVSNAEARLSELLGYDYDLGDSISVSTVLVSGSENSTEELEDAILDGVDKVSSAAVISVNGVKVGALPSVDAAKELLNGVLDDFRTDETVDIGFRDDIRISTEFVTDGLTQDPNAIRSLLDPLNAFSDVSLTVVSSNVRMRQEPIPYTVEYRDDPSAYEESIKLITPGADGKKVVSETYECVNGVEVSSKISGEIITKEPVTEVAVRGTAPRPDTASNGIYIWPATGSLTSYFGYRDDVEFAELFHRGLDIADPCGTPIHAADGGEVICAEYRESYGNIVKIRHDNGDVSWYAHCDYLVVEEGERVAQGEVIAYMGSTGDATGDHLHFEIHPGGGSAVDPLCYLPW